MSVMPMESHKSVADTAVQSAADTRESTLLDAPYSAS
jgi:hypothetical protein